MTRTPRTPSTRRAPALGLALTLTLTLGVLAVGAGPGCNAFALKTPDSFVSLERMRSRMYYKAVSPDNAVITISAFEHKDKGSLAYWAEILKREMTLRKGYTLQALETVKTARGVEGRRLVFLTHSGSTKYRYAAHLFVTKKYIHVLETAAKEKAYAQHQAAFDAAVATFRPR